MEKPVIILGGGIWGSLLAMRLKEVLPHIPFRLYEEESALGNHESVSFRESDCRESMSWLRPLISHSWKQHQMKGEKFEKWITEPYHHIESTKFHEVISSKLDPENLRLSNMMSAEFAIQEGSFVIDARTECFFSKSGYKKDLILEVELADDHHMIAPVVFDNHVDRKESARHISYYPLTSNTLLIKDCWYSDNRQLNLNEMRNSLMETLSNKGWKITRVIREETKITDVPLSPPVIREEGRVISLAGLFHDTTGSSITMATTLIDQMVKTSFRYGELKEVVKKFRNRMEIDRQFLRFMNRLLIEQKQHQVFEVLYKQPSPLIERFSRGNLKVIDRYKILAGKSNYEVGHLLKSVKLSNVFTLTRLSNNTAT
jgi:lycopene beta-cyclase